MKYIIVIILIVIILKANIQPTDRCDLETAKNAIPVRIFIETTIDSHIQPVLVTRFFHNKVTILLNELGRCYFNFFDLNLTVAQASIFGLVPWLYFLFKVLTKITRYPLLVTIFIVPAIPLLVSFPQVAYVHKVFAIIGLVLWLKSE